MTTLLSDVYFNTLYFQYHKAIGTSERYSLGISLPADVIGTQTANITEYVTLKELGHEKGFLASPSTALGLQSLLLLLSYFLQLQFKALASHLLCSCCRALSEPHFCEG